MTPSHRYEIRVVDLAQILAGPLAAVVLFALAMRLLIWPKPWAALDVDRTILLHQAEASLKQGDAELLLIGDSSCLMDLSARQLSEWLGRPVLNLATLSDVPLETHARLAHNYCETNPGRVKTVVVMMHPQTLRLGTRTDYFAQVIEAHLAGREHSRRRYVARWLGGETFRARILARVLPASLPGPYGEFYGFNWVLWRFMDAQRGSAIDPRKVEKFEGSPEARLGAGWEEASKRFRAALPEGIRIMAGIAPSPASFVLPEHASTCQKMLETWAGWLGAEPINELPFVLPDNDFASATHLNETGARKYSAMAGRLASEWMP